MKPCHNQHSSASRSSCRGDSPVRQATLETGANSRASLSVARPFDRNANHPAAGALRSPDAAIPLPWGNVRGSLGQVSCARF